MDTATAGLHAAFLADILAHPEDDGLRLIYADWLEERSDPRGEFIRIQLELAKRPSISQWCRAAPSPCHRCADCLRWTDLRRREREIWAHLFRDVWPWSWLPEGIGPGGNAEARAAGVERGCCLQLTNGHRPDDWYATFRRGFVEEVSLPLAAWCGESCPDCSEDRWRNGRDGLCMTCHGSGVVGRHGPRLIRAAPLERVVLTDREPGPVHDGWWRWWDAARADGPDSTDRDELPTAVWNLAHAPDAEEWDYRFNSKEEAVEAASHGLLTWARHAAELEDVRAALGSWKNDSGERSLSREGIDRHAALRARERELVALVEGRGA